MYNENIEKLSTPHQSLPARCGAGTHMDILNKIADWLWPEKCLGCKRKNSGYLCPECLNKIPPCFDNSNILAAASYKSPIVKKAIRLLKYRRAKKLAEPLAKLIFQRILQGQHSMLPLLTLKDEALIIPIPLSKKRLRERGFNQAELIARILSDKLSVKIACNVLEKIKHTESQVKAGKQEKRLKNLKGSFRVSRPELIKEKNIILVDDVATTGATLFEAGRVLKKSGAREIIPIVVAKG